MNVIHNCHFSYILAIAQIASWFFFLNLSFRVSGGLRYSNSKIIPAAKCVAIIAIFPPAAYEISAFTAITWRWWRHRAWYNRPFGNTIPKLWIEQYALFPSAKMHRNNQNDLHSVWLVAAHRHRFNNFNSTGGSVKCRATRSTWSIVDRLDPITSHRLAIQEPWGGHCPLRFIFLELVPMLHRTLNHFRLSSGNVRHCQFTEQHFVWSDHNSPPPPI